jgi:2-polyprenyl-3-methyl-5-hydroxy-6-metoxy-1,4-benzoquinol methylase
MSGNNLKMFQSTILCLLINNIIVPQAICITEVVEACDLKLIDITGMKLNWRLNEWQQSQDVSINYIMSFGK